MGWLKRILGREDDHETWLAAHPGKSSVKSMPPPTDEAEEARTRDNMEKELDRQRANRGG